MEPLVKDLLESLKRLNDELESRVSFEHNLMDIIASQKNTISGLNKAIKNYKEQYEDLQKQLSEQKETVNAENLIKDCVSKKGIIE